MKLFSLGNWLKVLAIFILRKMELSWIIQYIYTVIKFCERFLTSYYRLNMIEDKMIKWILNENVWIKNLIIMIYKVNKMN